MQHLQIADANAPGHLDPRRPLAVLEPVLEDQGPFEPPVVPRELLHDERLEALQTRCLDSSARPSPSMSMKNPSTFSLLMITSRLSRRTRRLTMSHHRRYDESTPRGGASRNAVAVPVVRYHRSAPDRGPRAGPDAACLAGRSWRAATRLFRSRRRRTRAVGPRQRANDAHERTRCQFSRVFPPSGRPVSQDHSPLAGSSVSPAFPPWAAEFLRTIRPCDTTARSSARGRPGCRPGFCCRQG